MTPEGGKVQSFSGQKRVETAGVSLGRAALGPGGWGFSAAGKGRAQEGSFHLGSGLGGSNG